MSKPDESGRRTPAAAGPAPGEEAFLRRWSRRKHAARTAEEVVDKQPAIAAATAAAEPPPPAKVLTDADMPPIESLDEHSDFSPFLSAGVSEGLRRMALQKLFRLPGIGERYLLESEYYDCHGFEPLGNIVTYDMREEMERAAEKLKASAEKAMRDLEPDSAGAPGPTEDGAPPPHSAGGADVAASQRDLRKKRPREGDDA